MSTSAQADDSAFIMPNLAEMMVLALDHGEINAIVGQRHFTGSPVLQWDKHFNTSHNTPVFHAYGFGGSGLTLAPSVAEYIANQVGQQIINDHKKTRDSSEVIIFGAGYIGILTALQIRHQLNRINKQMVPIRIIAQAYPKGISDIFPDKKEPALKDNYSSMTAGGWVMPVSVEPLSNKRLWCDLVQRAQELWQGYSQAPPLNIATNTTRSLVFYDQLAKITPMEDKSGIQAVNSECPLNLYPEHRFQGTFHGWDYHGENLRPLYFEQVITFDNVIQTDTVSVLKYMTEQLATEGIALIQTDGMIASFDQLRQFFTAHQKTIVINASGHGASGVFHGEPSTPVRGDLVILRIPTERMTNSMREVSQYGFWAGGSHYVFQRYTLDGQWLEVVLGGTFLKNDHDLMIRPETIRHIVSFWLDFFHKAPANKNESAEKSALIKRVLQSMLFPDTIELFPE